MCAQTLSSGASCPALWSASVLLSGPFWRSGSSRMSGRRVATCGSIQNPLWHATHSQLVSKVPLHSKSMLRICLVEGQAALGKRGLAAGGY
eukprot:scaffold137360_cov13-Tisochrysis_lutea.AAC.2